MTYNDGNQGLWRDCTSVSMFTNLCVKLAFMIRSGLIAPIVVSDCHHKATPDSPKCSQSCYTDTGFGCPVRRSDRREHHLWKVDENPCYRMAETLHELTAHVTPAKLRSKISSQESAGIVEHSPKEGRIGWTKLRHAGDVEKGRRKVRKTEESTERMTDDTGASAHVISFPWAALSGVSIQLHD